MDQQNKGSELELLQKILAKQQFAEYPSLKSEENDLNVIKNYYIQFQIYAQKSIVSSYQIYNHLNTKTPHAHQIFFAEFFHFYNNNQQLDWKRYESGYKLLTESQNAPSIIDNLNTIYEDIKSHPKPGQLKLLLMKVSHYRMDYPNEPISYKTLYKWFISKFAIPAQMALQQLPELYAYIGGYCDNVNNKAEWENFVREMNRYAIFSNELNLDSDKVNRAKNKNEKRITGKEVDMDLIKKFNALSINLTRASKPQKSRNTKLGRCFFCGNNDHKLKECEKLNTYKSNKVLNYLNYKICDMNGNPIKFNSIPFMKDEAFEKYMKSNNKASQVNFVNAVKRTAEKEVQIGNNNSNVTRNNKRRKEQNDKTVEIIEERAEQLMGPKPKYKNYSNLQLTDKEEDELVEKLISLPLEVDLKTVVGLNRSVLAKTVKKIKSSQHENSGPPNMVHKIEAIGGNKNDDVKNTYSEILAEEIDKQTSYCWSKGPLLYINAKVNGVHTANVLVDTGSQISIVSSEFAEEAKLEIVPCNYSGTGFNNVTTKFDGQTCTIININGINYGINLLVLDTKTSNDILLGQNFIVPNKLRQSPVLDVPCQIDPYIMVSLAIPYSCDDNTFRVPFIVEQPDVLYNNYRVLSHTDSANDTKNYENVNKDSTIECEILKIEANKKFSRKEYKMLRDNLKDSIFNSKEKEYYLNRIKDLRSTFYFDGDISGKLNISPIDAEFLNKQPWNLKTYPISPSIKNQAILQLKKMFEQKKIKYSKSPYNNPIFFQKKKDKSLRPLADLRELNKQVVKESSVALACEDLSNELSRCSIFSIVDLKSAFEQIPVTNEFGEKTAFWSPIGKMQYTTLPQGYINSPAIFQRLMYQHLAKVIGNILIFMDDIAVYNPDQSKFVDLTDQKDNELRQPVCSHIDTLVLTIKELGKIGFKINAQKFQVGVNNGVFLGFQFVNGKRFPLQKQLERIQAFEKPTSVRQLRKFLGICNFYRSFINGYNIICGPLYHLLNKVSKIENWNDIHTDAFEKIKEKFKEPPGLVKPDYSKPLVLYTDASIGGYGCVLFNIENIPKVTANSIISSKKKELICYDGKTFDNSQLHFNIYEKEMFAIYHALKKFYKLINSAHIYICCDNSGVIGTLKKDIGNLPINRISNWLARIVQFDFTLIKLPGKHNLADIMSRLDSAETIEDINGTNKIYNITSINDNIGEKLITTTKDVYEILKQINFSTISNSSSYKEFFSNHEKYIQNIIDTVDLEYYKGVKITDIREYYQSIDTSKVFKSEKEKKIIIQFFVCKGKLYKKSNGMAKLVIFNPYVIVVILHYFHDTSHKGINALCAKVKESYYVPQVEKLAAFHVKTCVVCQLYCTYGSRSPPLNMRAPVRIFESVVVDTVRMPEEDGYKYLLIARDEFTNWPEALPLKALTASAVADFLHREFICRHGPFYSLTTDGGTEFTAEVILELITRFKISHIVTSAYHPQSNGAAEAGHKSIVQAAIRLKGKWYENIPMSLAADRWTAKRVLGFSPGYLVYGYMGPSPIERILQAWEGKEDKQYTTDELIFIRAQQFDNRDVAIENAKANVQVNREKAKIYYDKVNNTTALDFPEGSIVLVKDPIYATRRNKKRYPRWNGPYRVGKKLNYTYRLEELDGTPISRLYMAECLKPFQLRPDSDGKIAVFKGGTGQSNNTYFDPQRYKVYDSLLSTKRI